MTDIVETPELTPHPFLACDGVHLFRREPHCAVCERPESDPIHAEVAAA